MNLFYAAPEDIQENWIKLRNTELKHAVKVLRLRRGDEISVTDGKGTLYHCTIEKLDKDSADLTVQQTEKEEPLTPELTLCIGLIKKRDRLEFAVEKAVELGINKIVVYRGDHSEKQNVRMDRLESTALSAMKQSLRTYLPAISLCESLKSALEESGSDVRKIVADQDSTSGVIPEGDKKYCLIVGPEGGFSSEEKALLKSAGAISYSLGTKRLRTETAAIAMVDRFRNAL